MTTGTVVPHEDTFLIVGGRGGKKRLDTIYIYDVDSESWLELNGALPRPMASIRAIKADMNIFPSCI